MPLRPLLPVIAGLLVSGPLAAQAPNPAPTPPTASAPAAAAYDYFAALGAESLEVAARLLEPEGLAAFKRTFVAFSGTEAGQEVLGLFDVPSAAELGRLTDAQVFARFLAFSMGEAGSPLAILKDSKYTIIGEVQETPTLVHVVARIESAVEGMALSDVVVVTVQQTRLGWRLELPGEIQAMLAGLQAVLSEMIQ